MKYLNRFFVGLFLFLGVLISCEDIDDNPVPSALEVKDFIWKGLNLYYYWQADEPNLADNRFANQRELNLFLETYNSPEATFEDLLVERTTDRFSVLFNDYQVLENLLQGSFKTNGIEYGLKFKDASQTDIYGWVRYVLPNTDAASKNITRGMIFYEVNSIPMTAANEADWRRELARDSYTLKFADYNNGAITPNGVSITLQKSEYTENPVFITNVVEVGPHKIGYLMYNGFYAGFEQQLNQAFAQFSGAGVTHLVLDLRYNSGGSVNTATRLASMITGQFSGQIFAKQEWNAKVEAFFNANNPSALLNRFTTTLSNGNAINSLNLSKVYVLTTATSASASELLINGLKPYINVVQIGLTTSGKNVGSITLYDSPQLTNKQNINRNHKYAMQPIVLKIVNRDGFGDYQNGIAPLIQQSEDIGNLGVLGQPEEPYFATAISHILENGRMRQPYVGDLKLDYKDSKSFRPLGDEMYLDAVPEGLLELLK